MIFSRLLKGSLFSLEIFVKITIIHCFSVLPDV